MTSRGVALAVKVKRDNVNSYSRENKRRSVGDNNIIARKRNVHTAYVYSRIDIEWASSSSSSTDLWNTPP